MLEISNRDCTYVMKDPSVICENAVPTVEGIIADVINNTDKTLADSRVLVFGYGNIDNIPLSLDGSRACHKTLHSIFLLTFIFLSS